MNYTEKLKEISKKTGAWIVKAANWIMKPIIEDFNFFLAIWLMNCSVTIGYIVGIFLFDNYVDHGMRCLALGTFVSYIFVVLLHLCKKRGIRIAYKSLIYFIFVSLTAVLIFVGLNFEMVIGARLFTLLAETNHDEASEFIATYAFAKPSLWTYGIVIVIIILLILMEWKRRWFTKAAKKKVMRIILTVLLVPLILFGAWYSHNYVKMASCKHSKELKDWVDDFGDSALDNVTSVVYSLSYLGTSKADIQQAEVVAKEVYKTPVVITEPDSLNVVMVFGESYIKSHASLYGYELNTTPMLIAERNKGNLIVFNDMITPYNATSTVQKNFFSLNDMTKNEFWYEKPTFATVFHHAGYKVYIWDMQREYQTTQLYTIAVNSFVYNDVIAKLSYDEMSSIPFKYDGQMIADFKNNSKVAPGKYNLYIFHLKGQHVNPSYRYPKTKRFCKFTSDSVRRNDDWLTNDMKKYIAHYDNATLYNDAVMKSIFDIWRDKNTVVVYLPDHGDEAYDFRDHCGRQGGAKRDARYFHCDNDVPFMVWCSDTFIAKHPDLVEQMRAAVDRPGIGLDVSIMLLRLGGIKTPYYDATRDISSPQYKPKKRIVYDRYDYDEVVKKAK